jgi:phosphoglycolate phosphatase-like HAD superfamily hydrolase
VPELLAALKEQKALQGLATGNFREAAFMKIEYFGLAGYLHEGGFGDDAELRSRLVAIAIERMANGAKPSQVWVIGDTPLDIEAAHDNNARAFAVATGTHSVDQLHEAGADVVVEDLADTGRVTKILLG